MNKHVSKDFLSEKLLAILKTLPVRQRFCVAYMSPMDFRQLYPDFATDNGEKSAPVMGLNDVFGRLR